MIVGATIKQTDFDKKRQRYDFDIVDDKGKKVGHALLRLIPSKSAEMPEGFESHVCYRVNPKERDKDYATHALKQMLKVAKKHGINPVVATANEDNIASIKVIEKNGGQKVADGKTTDGQAVLKFHLPV